MIWSALMGVPAVVVAIVTLGSASVARRTGPFLFQTFSRGACRIIGVHIDTRGSPPAGESALCTPNHWGYVDVFVLASLYRGVFVSRADLARWPIVGVFSRMGGTLFLERSRRSDAARVGDEIEVALRAGCRVTAFLEGGAGPGREVRPFKSPLLEAAVRAGAECRPIAIRYELPRDPSLDPGEVVAWIDEDAAGHFWRLLGTRRVDARVTFLPPRRSLDRKSLAKSLESDVRTALAAS